MHPSGVSSQVHVVDDANPPFLPLGTPLPGWVVDLKDDTADRIATAVVNPVIRMPLLAALVMKVHTHANLLRLLPRILVVI